MGCWGLMAIILMNKFGQVSTSRAWSLRAGECSTENCPIWHWHVWCSDGLDFFTLISHGTECHICGLQWAFWLGRWLTTHELGYPDLCQLFKSLFTSVNWKKVYNLRVASYVLSGGKRRTAAWEAASQIALRDCSKAAVGESQYMKFWWRGTSIP